ncbi:hypothetical protein Droror1_Dr00004344 [Drosera rotundifolia]
MTQNLSSITFLDDHLRLAVAAATTPPSSTTNASSPQSIIKLWSHLRAQPLASNTDWKLREQERRHSMRLKLNSFNVEQGKASTHLSLANSKRVPVKNRTPDTTLYSTSSHTKLFPIPTCELQTKSSHSELQTARSSLHTSDLSRRNLRSKLLKALERINNSNEDPALIITLFLVSSLERPRPPWKDEDCGETNSAFIKEEENGIDAW